MCFITCARSSSRAVYVVRGNIREIMWFEDNSHVVKAFGRQNEPALILALCTSVLVLGLSRSLTYTTSQSPSTAQAQAYIDKMCNVYTHKYKQYINAQWN